MPLPCADASLIISDMWLNTYTSALVKCMMHFKPHGVISAHGAKPLHGALNTISYLQLLFRVIPTPSKSPLSSVDTGLPIWLPCLHRESTCTALTVSQLALPVGIVALAKCA